MKTTRTPSRQGALAQRRWYLIDAQGAVVGRVASKIASILRGKNKAVFAPHQDTGDFVIVINAAGLRLTGKKLDNKVYYRHTGYPGGIRSVNARRQMEEHPERVLRDAVEGMLPKNRLGRRLAVKLKIYPGAEHPHAAQQPVSLTP
jgi:large subunit ribosomal protein L13